MKQQAEKPDAAITPKKIKAVIVFSGGLDSTVALAQALSENRECLLLHFDYFQKNWQQEGLATKKIADHYGLKFSRVDLTGFVGFAYSALTNPKIKLPSNRAVDTISSEIGLTYIPCRNAIFLALASSYAESINAEEVWVGFNYNDAQGRPSPDGRLIFLRAMETAITLGSKTGTVGTPIRFEAPLIYMGKDEILKLGYELDAPMCLTRTCFSGQEKPCGKCDSCVTLLDAQRRVNIFW